MRIPVSVLLSSLVLVTSCSSEIPVETEIYHEVDEVKYDSLESDLFALDSIYLRESDASIWLRNGDEYVISSILLETEIAERDQMSKTSNLVNYYLPGLLSALDEFEKERAYTQREIKQLHDFKKEVKRFTDVLSLKAALNDFYKNRNTLANNGIYLSSNSSSSKYVGILKGKSSHQNEMIKIAEEKDLVKVYDLLLAEYKRMKKLRLSSTKEQRASIIFKDYKNYFSGIEAQYKFISHLIKPETKKVIDSLNEINASGVYLSTDHNLELYKRFNFSADIPLEKASTLNDEEQKKMFDLSKSVEVLLERYKLNKDLYVGLISRDEDNSYTVENYVSFIESKIESLKAFNYFLNYRLKYEKVFLMEKKLELLYDLKITNVNRDKEISLSHYPSKLKSDKAYSDVKEYLSSLEDIISFQEEFNGDGIYDGASLLYVTNSRYVNDKSYVQAKTEIIEDLINNVIKNELCKVRKIDARKAKSYLEQISKEALVSKNDKADFGLGENISYVNPDSYESLLKRKEVARRNYDEKLKNVESFCQ